MNIAQIKKYFAENSIKAAKFDFDDGSNIVVRMTVIPDETIDYRLLTVGDQTGRLRPGEHVSKASGSASNVWVLVMARGALKWLLNVVGTEVVKTFIFGTILDGTLEIGAFRTPTVEPDSIERIDRIDGTEKHV